MELCVTNNLRKTRRRQFERSPESNEKNHTSNPMATELWATLLRESSKRNGAPHAACIVLGDKDVGKSTLLSKITSCSTHEATAVKESSSSQSGNHRRIKDVLSYGYLDVEDGLLDSSSTSRVNFWGISDASFDGCVEMAVRPQMDDPVAYVVGVDVSRPDSCVESLLRWLVAVRQCANRSQGSGTEPGSVEQKRVVLWNDLGKTVPVIVVVTKSDMVKIDDAMSMKRSKELQGQLREIGLVVGASVVYISSADDTNIASLKRHILNRLYPEVDAWAAEDSIEDGVNCCFVPSATDNASLIFIATGYDIRDQTDIIALLDAAATTACASIEGTDEEKSCGHIRIRRTSRVTTNAVTSSASLSSSKGAAAAASGSMGGIELEEEEEWLAGLQSYIAQVTAAGVSPSAPSSSSSSQQQSATSAKSAGAHAPTTALITAAASVATTGSVSISRAIPGTGTTTPTTTTTTTTTATDKVRKASTAAGTASATATATTGPPSAPPVAEGRATRRSTRTAAVPPGAATQGQKEEVGDFFKNLLLGGAPPPPAPTK